MFTSQYSFGFGPPCAEKGDMIYSVDGADVPLVFRQKVDHYMFAGEAILQEPVHSQRACGVAYFLDCNCQSCSGYQRFRSARAEAQYETLYLQ